MLKTMRFEVHMPSIEPDGKKIKIKRTFEGHFPGLIWHIFLATIEASKHEWRVRSDWLIKKIQKNVALDRHVLESEIRIVVLIFLNLIATTWIINQKFFIFSLPYNLAHGEEMAVLPSPPDIPDPDLAGMTRLETERDKNDQDKTKEEEGKTIIEELNKLIASQDERCLKDKNDEKCTELCVKNEEEIIAKMKEEERRAWMKYLAGRPKLIPSGWVSCAEKNDGDPSKSKTKGKHRDEDCCPDPDEWPKPGCRYSAKGLALMLNGPKK